MSADGGKNMKTVHVSTGKPYDIYIERGVMERVGEYASQLSRAKRVTIVTDSNVAPLYQWRVINSLSAAGFEVNTHIFRAGEESKHLGTIAEIYKSLADFGMTRKDLIVALGGGVCGDMAGFAAATYLRGIDFMQIPTSLLAQVDSSVGGKTGVDLPQGKNLVGAFHQPVAVLIDPDTLMTLPDRFIIDGLGEIIKYGCIKDAAFFEFLENENARMLLNFGHTLGHAIEKLYGFKDITHGMAVAVGMVMMARAGEERGITAAGTADRVESLCRKYCLPTSEELSFASLAGAAKADKKTAGDSISLVLLRSIGDSFTRAVPLDELEEFITFS